MALNSTGTFGTHPWRLRQLRPKGDCHGSYWVPVADIITSYYNTTASPYSDNAPSFWNDHESRFSTVSQIAEYHPVAVLRWGTGPPNLAQAPLNFFQGNLDLTFPHVWCNRFYSNFASPLLPNKWWGARPRPPNIFSRTASGIIWIQVLHQYLLNLCSRLQDYWLTIKEVHWSHTKWTKLYSSMTISILLKTMLQLHQLCSVMCRNVSLRLVSQLHQAHDGFEDILRQSVIACGVKPGLENGFEKT